MICPKCKKGKIGVHVEKSMGGCDFEYEPCDVCGNDNPSYKE